MAPNEAGSQMGLQMQFLNNENKKRKRDRRVYGCDLVCSDGPSESVPSICVPKEGVCRFSLWRSMVVKRKL